ncbi:MAG: 2-oxoglutarate dehydrogenase E1 component [Verrucomicrobiaceae bacterium]|nr:2-oxoglutarate dehydrogenase E1 component [Verrucomicrobiaceae bacterium]
MSASLPYRANADFLESKYIDWKKDPASVEPLWSSFFEGFELGMAKLAAQPAKGGADGAATLSEKTLSFRMRVTNAIQHFRSLGHTAAHLDPLSTQGPEIASLSVAGLGFTDEELEEEVQTHMYRGGQPMKLKTMLAELRRIYCGKTGFEFMHIHNPEVRTWLLERIEVTEPARPAAKEHIDALRWLLEAETFERFLHRRFVGQKRFSVEGGESMLVALETILEGMPAYGGREIVMGMAHRGRLSVLANFLRKPLEYLFYEFSENYVPNMVAGDGDVKYHLGFETVRQTSGGSSVGVMLAPNPSHLEAVDPVVEGMARARQRALGDTTERRKVVPLLIHGDAAFAGQGLVAEVLNLSQLPGYRTGGTIHVIVNNQIGFTTMPEDARSSHYCTDVAKMIEAPVFHVNGDCPMEVVRAAKLALEFRQTFGRDVIIDIVCYRRHGHNETDEPGFTQPNMARAIGQHPSTATLFRLDLASQGILDEAGSAALQKELEDELEQGVATLAEKDKSANGGNPFEGSMAMPQPAYDYAPVNTGIELRKLKTVGERLLETPEGFNLHPTIAKRFLAARKKAIEAGEGIDWAYAESLAFGTLLTEGHGVRLSGQDVRRGTFSHRHSVFYDSQTRERHIPLNNLQAEQGRYCVYNSLLSEAAVLGFDYGYSLLASNLLVCWEAQFGDFVNGAQVIIDQFIASAESKWQRPSHITLLLPHGYEGQGPEHSSARLERFLQLCAGGNMQVCNFTTPAQYFHALRRQLKRSTRKPLVVMTPKSLLRHPKCVSKLADMAEGTTFKEVLDDEHLTTAPERVTRLILCSGKVYYDLLEFREEHKIKNAAIIRIEQLYPLNYEMLKEIVAKYPRAQKKWIWCQEEPRNMGAHYYIRPRLEELSNHKLRYAGRERSSSPAAGSKAIHSLEQDKLVEDAFSV